MIYRVTVNYNDFDFNDNAEAIVFAETAKRHYSPPIGKENKEAVIVTIKLIMNESPADGNH